MPPVCNKCKQGNAQEGDTWCLGCSSLELSLGLLKQSWRHQGLRAVAEESAPSSARLIRAFANLDHSLISGGAGSSDRAPAVSAKARHERRTHSRSPRRDTRPPLPRSPKRATKVEPRSEKESEDFDEDEEEEEDDGRPITEVHKEHHHSERPPEPEGPPPSRASERRGSERGEHRDERRAMAEATEEDTPGTSPPRPGDPGYLEALRSTMRQRPKISVMQIYDLEEADFWRHCYLPVGSVMEIDTQDSAQERPTTQVALLVTSCERDDFGLWVGVTVLGSPDDVVKKSLQAFFKAGRRMVHLCHLDKDGVCHIGDEPGLHIRKFRWFPPGDFRAPWLNAYALKKIKEGPKMAADEQAALDGDHLEDAGADLPGRRSETEARLAALRGNSARVQFADPLEGSRPHTDKSRPVKIETAEEPEEEIRDGFSGGRCGPSERAGEERGEETHPREESKSRSTTGPQEEEAEQLGQFTAFDFLAQDGVLDPQEESVDRSQRPKLYTYYQLGLKPGLDPRSRDSKELALLCRALDMLKEGKLDSLADLLSARLMAVETATKQGWATARHLEIFDAEDEGPAPAHILLAAQKHGKQVERAGGKGSWPRSQSWPSTWQGDGQAKGKAKENKGKGKKGKGRGKWGKAWQQWGGDKEKKDGKTPAEGAT
eukprot:s676_g20.t1